MSDRLLASPTCQVISAAMLFATVPPRLIGHSHCSTAGKHCQDGILFTMRGRERGESDEGRGAGGGLEVRVT